MDLCAYTKNTLLYGFNKSDSFNFTLVYFNYVLRQKRIHNVDNVINISGDNGFFAIFSKETNGINSNCVITVTDTIGVFISVTSITFMPIYFAMHGDIIACADQSSIVIWNFQRETEPLIKTFSNNIGKIVSDNKSNSDANSSDIADDQIKDKDNKSKNEPNEDSNDCTICAICLIQTSLIVSIKNGLIFYDSISLTELKRAKLGITPNIITSSCDMKRLALVDNTGLLQFFNVATSRIVGPAKKDISSVLWSSKVASYVAMREKQKITVYDNMILEDTFQSKSKIVNFNEIEILTVDIMQIMKNPLNPDKKYFKTYPTKLVKNLKKMLADRPVVPLENAINFVKQQNNPQLMDELAQILLTESNLSMAEKCYLENQNYQGLQFIKRVRAVRDPKLQRAQILSYYGRFDDAQNIYESIDRTDLSVEMRSLIGDYQMIINILGSSSSDDAVAKAYQNLGEMHIENHDWKSAVKAFQKSKDKAKLALSLFITDDFDGLNKLFKKQSSRSQILPLLGSLFLALGASDESVEAFEKGGDIQSAIGACMRLNNWKRAIDIVTNYNETTKDGSSNLKSQRRAFQIEIRAKMMNYTNQLIQNGQISTAIDFYSQAGLELEAAKLLVREGDKIREKSFSTKLISAKKFYIFAGLKLVEQIKASESINIIDTTNQMSSTISSSAALSSTMTASPSKKPKSFTGDFSSDNSLEVSNLLEEAWRKAEGVHFYLLAHKLMSQKKWESALLCAVRVYELYSNIVGEDRAAALLAVCGMKSGYYQQCSKAFTSLEYYDDYSKERREKFENLAIDIFTKKPPIDPKMEQSKFCPKCQNSLNEMSCQCNQCGYKIPICVASGLLITDNAKWECQYCKHNVSFDANIDSMPVCPFCHQLVTS